MAFVIHDIPFIIGSFPIDGLSLTFLHIVLISFGIFGPDCKFAPFFLGFASSHLSLTVLKLYMKSSDRLWKFHLSSQLTAHLISQLRLSKTENENQGTPRD